MKKIGIVIIVLVIIAVFILGMLTEKMIKYQIKFEYYTKDGEKGTTYYCESTELKGNRCAIDGNLIEVAQFSESEK